MKLAMLHFNWTNQKVDQLRQLVADRLSASQIAKILGITRNAVIGKTRRIGIKLDSKTPQNESKKIPRVRKWKPKLNGHVAPAAAVTSTGITFDELRYHHCRFPVNEDHPFLFCGDISLGNLPYCAEHHRLAHKPSWSQHDSRIGSSIRHSHLLPASAGRKPGPGHEDEK